MAHRDGMLPRATFPLSGFPSKCELFISEKDKQRRSSMAPRMEPGSGRAVSKFSSSEGTLRELGFSGGVGVGGSKEGQVLTNS